MGRMKYPIIIKQSPLVLIRRIIGLELLVGVLLFIASFIANYEELYLGSFAADIVRYDIFLVFVASILQLSITLIVFFWWHSEEYRIKEKEIIYRRGLFLERQRSILYANIKSVEFERNPLELLMGYGTIIIDSIQENRALVIQSVENAEIYTNIIKDSIDSAIQRTTQPSKKRSILDLILEGESFHLELKQTFRWDLKQKVINKSLEKSVMKTIAAFLNSDGGNLVIGVTDSGKIHGLEDDYRTLVRKDRDGFENHFNQVFKNMLGAEFRQCVTLSFETIEEKDVCLVEVRHCDKPVFLRMNGEEEFFIRTGNTTSPLLISEVNSYVGSKWK